MGNRDERDDFNADVTRKLCDRVGGRCSNPDCEAVTKGPGEGNRIASVGVAAHIHAAASGGPRYDETQTPTERAAFENGIWLCNNCSRLVDGNETTFPAVVLRKWKADAELAAAQRIGKAPTLPDPLPLSDEARPHMEGIAVGWLAHGMHPVKAWSFRPQKRSGREAYNELLALNLIEPFAAAGWRLTDKGARWALQRRSVFAEEVANMKHQIAVEQALKALHTSDPTKVVLAWQHHTAHTLEEFHRRRGARGAGGVTIAVDESTWDHLLAMGAREGVLDDAEQV